MGARSVRSATASVRSVEVLSGDEASEGEHDVSYSTDEADVSQGSIPLLDISASDDDETRKRKARELACRSDTAFAAWKEKQISDGVKGIEERDQMVNDYTDGKRKPKNPDPLGPPVSYMEERGVFQPLASTTNTLGLCHFYHADPNTPMPTGPEPPGHGGACKEATAPCQHKATAVCHRGFLRWDCYSFGFVAGAAYAKRACPYPYLPDWGSQGRAWRTRVMLSILHVHHPK